MFKVMNLEFSYGKRTVFKDLNLEINAPFTGVIGVNGAGKTTLVKLSLGILSPSYGSIHINDVLINDPKQRKIIRVGVLHEHSRFPPWIQVFPYLAWVGQMRGFTRQEAQQQAHVFINLLGLHGRELSYFNELSAGLKQRFGIAQAFIGLPDLVFLDEPTANLDALSRVKILEFIKNLTQTHKVQVILFSHILADLEKYCDEVVILDNGDIQYQGSLKEVFQNFHVKQYVIRYPNTKIQDVKNIISQYNTTILSEMPEQLIIHVEDKATATKLLDELTRNDYSITPYKTVLEQLFEDLVQPSSPTQIMFMT